MDKSEKLILFWVCSFCGVAGIGIGVGQFSVGLGWIVGGILSFLIIPIGLEYNKKFMK